MPDSLSIRLFSTHSGQGLLPLTKPSPSQWCITSGALVASNDGREGSVSLNQDIELYAALVDGDETIHLEIPRGQKAWVQMARGTVVLNGEHLSQGDGASVSQALPLDFAQGDGAEILLFLMPQEA